MLKYRNNDARYTIYLILTLTSIRKLRQNSSIYKIKKKLNFNYASTSKFVFSHLKLETRKWAISRQRTIHCCWYVEQCVAKLKMEPRTIQKLEIASAILISHFVASGFDKILLNAKWNRWNKKRNIFCFVWNSKTVCYSMIRMQCILDWKWKHFIAPEFWIDTNKYKKNWTNESFVLLILFRKNWKQFSC